MAPKGKKSRKKPTSQEEILSNIYEALEDNNTLLFNMLCDLRELHWHLTMISRHYATNPIDYEYECPTVDDSPYFDFYEEED